jgi:hypothetical protein
MSEFPKRFTEIFERQPNQLRERFQTFADEQGYVIAEIESKSGFSFQILDKDTLEVADIATHEVFKSQFCILDESVSEENLHVEDHTEQGIHLHAEPKY